MLSQLTISHFVLIEQLTLQFGSGFCALTGETGAGKSIILDALGLVLGARAHSSAIQAGHSTASVTAVFEIPAHSLVIPILEEQGISIDDMLIIRRVVHQDGKSRAFINDTPVSVQLLANVGEHLVEIHGQHDQQGLFSSTKHRRLLDQFGQLESLVKCTSSAYEKWYQVQEALTILEAEKEQAERDVDYLRHAHAELDELGPQLGEEAMLAEQRQKHIQWLKSGEQLINAHQLLDEPDTLSRRIGHIQTALNRVPDFVNKLQIDQYLEQGYEAIARAQSLLEETIDQHHLDPSELDAIEKRLFALRALARKHHCTCDDLVALKESVAAKLELLNNQHVRLDTLQQETEHAKRVYVEAARALSQARQAQAVKLEQAIAHELPALKLGHCRFSIVCSAQEQFASHGMDSVQFLVATNPGQAPATLAKVASGGELSRLMLALKVVLTHSNATPTLIFDEIDTGIGGAVADAVGKRLKQLSQFAQILVVTHQPQVCSYAQHHYRVEKTVTENKTTTHVVALDPVERIAEVARMLAGEQITQEAEAAAIKLLSTI